MIKKVFPRVSLALKQSVNDFVNAEEVYDGRYYLVVRLTFPSTTSPSTLFLCTQ